jgi:hypothetical protein
MSQAIIPAVGEKYGRLTVIGSGRSKTGKHQLRVRCDCGVEKLANSYPIRHGKIQSCGCLRSEFGRSKAIHGPLSKSLAYSNWRRMLGRVRNPNHPDFKLYGRRGITVYEPWHTFTNFYADMGDRPAPRSVLSRIDKKGNYEPGNVVWESFAAMQARRRTKPRRIADQTKMAYVTAKRLIASGWTPPATIAA